MQRQTAGQEIQTEVRPKLGRISGRSEFQLLAQSPPNLFSKNPNPNPYRNPNLHRKTTRIKQRSKTPPLGWPGGGISGLTLLLLPIKIVLRQENVLHPQLEFPKARGPQGTIAHMRKHTARG